MVDVVHLVLSSSDRNMHVENSMLCSRLNLTGAASGRICEYFDLGVVMRQVSSCNMFSWAEMFWQNQMVCALRRKEIIYVQIKYK